MRFLLLFLFVLPLCAQPLSPLDSPFTQNCSSLLQNCVGYWRLEEAAGLRYDLTGFGNNLTQSGSPVTLAGVSTNTGLCNSFLPASSKNLSITSTPSLSMNGTSFTLAGWVSITLAPNSGHVMVILGKCNASSVNREYVLFCTNNATNKRFELFVSSDGTAANKAELVASTFGALSTATWYFVAAGYDIVAHSLFISVNNGPQDTMAWTNGVFNGSSKFELAGFDGGTEYLNGKLDEFGVWKRVLSANELARLFSKTNGTHFPFP